MPTPGVPGDVLAVDPVGVGGGAIVLGGVGVETPWPMDGVLEKLDFFFF